MSQVMGILGPVYNQLVMLAVSLVSIFILFSVIFKNNPTKAVRKIRCAFILSLISNIIFFFLLSRLIGKYFSNYLPEFGIIAFSFLIVFSFVMNLNTIITMKGLVTKSKKGGNLSDLFKEVSKEIFSTAFDVSLVFLIPIISYYFLGNGFMNGILSLLGISIIIVFFTHIILFPKFLKLAEKIFN